ncbi:gene transfer agent family protein [Terrarubrum flagellatum]|uniref:gene transfer agent family protein n=1 Tax=Terrirubrum flagellatum TaxID=2895980 RepID=UPI003145002A
MANCHRGEVDCEIGGRRFRLCLTLGALAEIESAFAVEGLAALGERLSSGKLGAKDFIAILGAAARGGGERIEDRELAALNIARELPLVIDAVAKLLRLAFADEAAPENPL